MDIINPPCTPAQDQEPASATPSNAMATNGTGKLQPPKDRVCWKSSDGLVVIKQLVLQAQKYPPSPYPCVVIQALPKPHERIRRWKNGVELMLAGEELEELVIAYNAAAVSQGKGELFKILQRVPPKSESRKRRWKRFNLHSAWRRRRANRNW